MIGQAGKLSDKRYDKVFDNDASLQEAQRRLPLKQLMEQHGLAPSGGRWKGFKCPFCQKKGKATVFRGNGDGDLFKCFARGCPSGTSEDGKAFDEVGFLAYVSNLNRKDAFIAFLKQTGVWEERGKFKSPKPEAAARHATEADQQVRPTDDEEALQQQPPTDDEASQQQRPTDSPEPAPLDVSAGEGTLPLAPADAPKPSEPAVNAPSSVEEPPASPASAAVVEPAGSGDSPSNIVALPAAASPVHGPPSPLPSPQGEGETPSAMNASPEAKGEGEAPSAKGASPVEVVREFYSKLAWSEQDALLCWEKRGLESRTCEALGFRSNVKSNRESLRALAERFEEELLLDSGLWVRSEKADTSKGRPKPGGKFWGWSRPNRDADYELLERAILIPYFNARGELISLRPHKDMGGKGTVTGRPHLYVPRRGRPAGDGGAAASPYQVEREYFRTCLVTEGEFKAAALWQIVGTGRKDGRKPVGVAAVPGISFGRNYEVRQEMERWLRMTGCQRLVVVFDNEEKGNPDLPGYKEDWQKRHDAQIWAEFLAIDIYQKLHIRGHVGGIADVWRDASGKADFDGVMGKVVNG